MPAEPFVRVESDTSEGVSGRYVAPSILWEQAFVALASISCVVGSDSDCGGGYGPEDPRDPRNE